MEYSFKLSCHFKTETENAVLIVDPLTDEEIWLPLSTVQEMVKHPDGSGYIIMDRWIAEKKRLL